MLRGYFAAARLRTGPMQEPAFRKNNDSQTPEQVNQKKSDDHTLRIGRTNRRSDPG
jgi:hypothetical protein